MDVRRVFTNVRIYIAVFIDRIQAGPGMAEEALIGYRARFTRN